MPAARESGVKARSAALEASRLETSRAVSDAATTVDVVLVSMPFGPLNWPSLGIGLLQAALRPLGISNSALYFGIPFAEQIGPRLYDAVSRGRPDIPDLAGEWIFSGALFEESRFDPECYIRDVLLGGARAHRHSKPVPSDFVEGVREARRCAPGFVARCSREVRALEPRVVCFTSVFHQHVASLALAKAVKLDAPETFVLFGGANCEGPMGLELIRQFPTVDAAVSGEADALFPRLVERILAGESIDDIQGVVTRRGCKTASREAVVVPPLMDLDLLPNPDFDDFFEQWEPFGSRHPEQESRVLFETSRGCWWGEKAHCTFCGLNGSSMAFRSKSADRAIDEFNHLTEQYPERRVFVVDTILDMKYFQSFIPTLVEQRNRVDLFYEVKANLTKKQLRLLHDGGIREIQPGIESLSTPILELMRKGVSALQNIQLLKWCKEIGVEPVWNFLWGFPGESPVEYERMAALVPWLTHLRAPLGPIPVRLDRFSPYFEQPGAFGFGEVEPYPSYFHVYPLDAESMARMAYYFTADFPCEEPLEQYTRNLAEQIATWQALGGRGDLFSMRRNGELLIFDTRPAARQPVAELAGVDQVLIEECDRIRPVGHLQRVVERRSGGSVSEDDLNKRLESLVEGGLMVREGDKYLTLSIPVGTYVPSEVVIADSLAALQGGGPNPRPANVSAV